MRIWLAFVTLLCAAPAAAQTLVPQKHVPAAVLEQLRAVEAQFEAALARDCAPERCLPKGCIYRDHTVVDLPRARSLPGFDEEEGPGSVPLQEYLTSAQCEFVHEKNVNARDLQALARRLEQKLSRGWLKVSIARQALEPLSSALAQPPADDEGAAQTPETQSTPSPTAATPPREQEAPARELWLTLLPHFAWMIALVLVTAAAMTLIWSLRRLGRESLEERALLAELGAQASHDSKNSTEADTEAEDKTPLRDDPAFVATAHGLWSDRIAQIQLGKDNGVIVELLRQWLKQGNFALLAKAIVVFGDRLSLAFPADGDLAVRKVEFADYLRQLDETTLPSDAEFFRKLGHHAVSSTLLSQTDAAVYHSLRDEFGMAGVAALMARLPPRFAALLFALSPTEFHQDLARALAPAARALVAGQLLLSNRMAPEEQTYLFAALAAARAGGTLPAAPPEGVLDRGREIDAAGPMALLLQELTPDERRRLFAEAVARWRGGLPPWCQTIVAPALLLNLPAHTQAELLLEVDVRELAAWLWTFPAAARQPLVDTLPTALQNALRAHTDFGSRAEQVALAARGRSALAAAVQRAAAAGKLSFETLWA